MQKDKSVVYTMVGLAIVMPLFLAALVIAILTTSGCNLPEKVAHQDEAMSLVYRSVYHDPTGSLPEIHWLWQDQMNCAPDVDGIYRGFYIGNVYGSSQHVRCVGGVTWLDWGITQVAWTDNTKGIWDTAFSHELYHTYLFNTTGDGDSSHSDPGFGPPFHSLPGVVNYANDDLMYEGW